MTQPVMTNSSDNVKDVSRRLARRKSGRPSADVLQGEELREHIIAAASVIYGNHGYRGTTIAKIAEAAGVSRPLFYRLFKDKWEILDIIIGRANDELVKDILVSLADTKDLFSMLSAGIDAYFNWCRNYGAVVGPLYQEINDPESPAYTHRKVAVKRIRDLTVENTQQRHFPDYSPLVFETLQHTIEHVGSSIFWPVAQPEQIISQYRAILLRIVTATLARPKDVPIIPSIESILINS